MADPDKKLKELQKKKPSVYQSNAHSKHFENEGAEFIEKDKNEESLKDGVKKDQKS